MQEIKCPNCGEIFAVDESGYAQIVRQIRDKEFEKELSRREKEFEQLKENALKISRMEQKAEFDKQLSSKEAEILKLKSQLANKETENELKEQSLKKQYEDSLRLKEEQIEYYKDFKARQSTKMLGESLEQHCLNEFNALRMTAFPTAYFEKDNDVRTGSKGDFIFRESADGIEFISIMFEMKNEMDETATKHKNEDFLKELDKDRRRRNANTQCLFPCLKLIMTCIITEL